MGQNISLLADKIVRRDYWKQGILLCSIQVEVLLDFFAELRVDRHHLIEKKQKTLMDGNDEKMLVLVHFRSIDDKSYIVTEINNGEDDALERQVESDMTEDEVKKFEEDWTNLWNPDFTQEEIEKLHQTVLDDIDIKISMNESNLLNRQYWSILPYYTYFH